jgi:hypothetical protein
VIPVLEERDMSQQLSQDGRRDRASLRRRFRWRALVPLAVAAICAIGAAPALAQGPALRLDALSNTTVPAGGTLQYLMQVTSVGDADTDGSTIDLVATLPSGMTAVSAGGATFVCTAGDGVSPVAGATVVDCQSTAAMFPSASKAPVITVAVDPSATGVLTTSFQVSGGGAADPVSTVRPVRIAPDAPPFGVEAFDGQTNADAGGTPSTQAGGHPYDLSTYVDFNTTTNPNPALGPLWPVRPAKDALVDLPAGVVGNPTVADRCTVSELANSQGILAMPLCSPTAQVGVVSVRALGVTVGQGKVITGPIPLFNIVPPDGIPAEFGFNLYGSVVTLKARVRSGGDYGLSVNVTNIPEGLAVAGTTVTFWGVPADASHDLQRACAGQLSPWQAGPRCPSGAPQRAFLRNTTSCTPPSSGPTDGLQSSLHVDSWATPGAMNTDDSPDLTDPAWQTTSFVSHAAPAYPYPPVSDQPSLTRGGHLLPTGCDKVPFDPALKVTPDAPARAGTPSAFAFDLTSPQNDDPAVIGESDLRTAVVTLPVGMRVSPSSADGLQACAPAQIGLHTTADPTCPDASKIGTMRIDTPLLQQPLTGSIYLAKQKDNPFGTLLAVYLVAQGSGVTVKLAGRVEADANTGQLTTRFDDNPQLPFSRLHLQFDGGAKAPLVTPPTCGMFETDAQLTSWSGTSVLSKSTFTIDRAANGGPCAPLGFSPGFRAGTVNPTAGADSAFSLQLSRGDGDQDLKSLTVDMPLGLTGRIANAALCADGAANLGTCQDESRIGSVTVGAGAGPNPFFITNGRAYLTGPYGGAPYGLSIVVPVIAGPFDLGTVVVRAAIFVDRNTAALRVVSDPLPTILQGIPLDVRDIQVNVDRPHFMLNPTSCAEQQVTAHVGSDAGASADVTSRFGVGECAALALKPKLAIALTGKGQTTDDKHPAVVASLTQPAGQANLKKVTVSLPLSLALDTDNANGLCEFADGSKDEPTCPKASIVGSATAKTPILNQPLTGPVYFVKNIRKDPKSGRDIRTLPKLVIPLTGENGVRLNVVGTSSVVGRHLVTTFDNLPDVPVSSFRLNIAGGKHGILVVSGADICKATQVADQQIDGQNGKTADAAITLATPACGLKVLSKKVGKTSVTLKVSGLGAGKVTVSGKNIKKTSRTIKAATVAAVTVHRTGHGRPRSVRVTFTPHASHKPITTTVSL